MERDAERIEKAKLGQPARSWRRTAEEMPDQQVCVVGIGPMGHPCMMHRHAGTWWYSATGDRATTDPAYWMPIPPLPGQEVEETETPGAGLVSALQACYDAQCGQDWVMVPSAPPVCDTFTSLPVDPRTPAVPVGTRLPDPDNPGRDRVYVRWGKGPAGETVTAREENR